MTVIDFLCCGQKIKVSEIDLGKQRTRRANRGRHLADRTPTVLTTKGKSYRMRKRRTQETPA